MRREHVLTLSALLAACDPAGDAELVSCDRLAEDVLVPCGMPGSTIVVPHRDGALADGCTHVRGGVHVPDGDEDSLAALSAVHRIDEQLSLFRGRQPSLASLAGLRLVGGELSIRLHEELASLDGLSGVCEVGALWIEANASLTSLDGLSSLRRVHGDVTIEENAQLPAAEIDAFLARIEVGGTIVVR